MNKDKLLRELSQKIDSGEISKEEVNNQLDVGPSPVAQKEKRDPDWFQHFSITKIFYILGAAIVIIGVVIFFVQVWDDIGSFGRIAVTLGLGLLFAVIGSVLLKSKPEDNIGAVFHFIGGVLISGGIWVTLIEVLDTSFPDSVFTIALTYCALFIFYLLLTFAHKHPVLTFFAVVNGTVSVYLLIEALTDGSSRMDLYAYLTMFVGLSYLLLAYAFRRGWNKKLISLLHFFGTFGFFGATYSQIFDSFVWQTLFVTFVVGGFFLSVKFKSRSILALSTIFLIAYLFQVTSQYFVNSLGWPISLVVLGLMIIGFGYTSININRKYIKN